MLRRSSRNGRRVVVVSLVLLAVLGFIWATQQLPEGAWSRWVASIPPSGLLAAAALLPLVGFPISVLYIALGARFGLAAGAAIVAGCTAIHLLLGFPLARLAQVPVRWLVQLAGWHLPVLRPDTIWPFAWWIALVPGVSYALKNYAAPIAGVPFRAYLGAFFPVHLAGGIAGLALGRVTVDFSWWLVSVIVVHVTAFAWVTRVVAKRLGAGGVAARRKRAVSTDRISS